MKKNRILASTLIAASFALSVPAVAAETVYLPTGTQSSESPTADSNGVIAAGDYAIASDAEQGWISPNGSSGDNIGYSNISFGSGTTFSGTGVIGIFFDQGNGGVTESVDLTNVTAYGLSGQLIVLNNWNSPTAVKISGESWANVEYLFGNVVDDETLAGTYGLTGITRGDLTGSTFTELQDTLALQGDTTLAGVTGASKGATTHDKGSSHTVVLCDNEFITVANNGDTLTIAGEGTYAFYGTAGTSSARLSLAMNSSEGAGKQTFGGTNYLYNVTVTKGTLALDGVTSITGSVSVAYGSELDLGGEITLSNTISNSGTVVIADGTSFVLDNLTAGHVEGTLIGYYEIVDSNGGSISYTADGTYTFIHNGNTLDGWNLYVDSSGNVYVYGEVGEFTWNGTSSNNTWSTSHDNQPWVIGTDGDSSYFVNGSDVTFGTDATYKIVNISETLTAGSIAVNDNYTFVFANGIKVEAGYVDVASGKTLTLQLTEGATSAEFHMDGETWYQFFSNANSRENHGTVEIGAGVTFYLSDSTETATIGSGNYGAVVTGTGTLSVETTGQIGLYLPNFEGTVEFRSGTVRIGHDNNYGDTGVFNSNATLQFDSGVGITLVGNTSSAVSAKLVFAEGSHTIATGGYTAEFSGTISGADATITITGAGNLTFSGGGAIGTVTINAGATLVFSGDSKTYTITTISKTNSNDAGTLEVSSGTTVNAGTLNGDWHIGTIQVDGVLNISDVAEFGSGSGNTETFTGTGTVTVGEFRVGHSSNGNNGATVKIDGGLTFIANTITTGKVTNNSHIQLGNATFGTSNANGLTFATTITEVTLTATGNEKTTFNTNVYDVTNGKFTDDGTTITIGVSVVGGGNMEVTGSGTLALSGTSTLGSVTVDNGATLDLSGGTVSVSSSIQNSGTVVVNNSTVFVLDNLSGTESASGTTYVIITDGGKITGWSDLDYSNFSVGGTTLTSGRQITFGTDGTITYNKDGVAQNLVWAGSNGNSTWTKSASVTDWTNGSSADYFASGDSVTFDDTASSKNVTIGEAVKAGSITISADYTFTFTDGGSVSSDNWTINSTLTLAGEGTVKFGSGTIDVSKIANAEGSNVTLEFVAGTFNSSSVTSTTNIQFSSSTPLTNDILLSGSGAVAIGLESIANIEISGKVTSGENVTIYRAANNGSGGDVLTFSGEVDIQGGYASYRGKTTFSGGGYIGTLTIYGHGYTDSVTLSGEEGTTYEIGSIVFTTSNSSNTGGDTLTVDAGVTVNAESLSASWGFSSITVDGTLNVSGTMNLSTGNAGSGHDAISGSGTLNVGTLNVGNVGSYTFSGLDLNIGSGGITTANSYTLTFGDGLTVGVYAGDNENKAWSSSANITLSGSVTFNPLAGESIVLSGTISGEGNLTKTGDGTLTISNYTVSGTTTVSEGTLVITGETALGGSAEIHVETGATLDLTGVTQTQTSGDTGTKLDVLYIEGGTVTANNLGSGWNGQSTNFGSGMYNYTLQISDGGVLDVVVAQGSSGGGERAFAVTSGEGTYRFSGTGTSYLGSTERSIHLGEEATLIFDVVSADATLDVSMVIAKGLASGTSDVVGSETSTGSLVKTGAGTLKLSGTNLYSGGTTIKEGVLVAASAGALGTGEVKIEGGQLSIDPSVTITNSVSVTLSNTYLVSSSLSPTSLGSGTLEPYATGEDGIYAITGTGTLNTTITLFIDDTIAKLLAEAGEEGLGFYIVDTSGVSEDSSFTVSLSEALSGYTYTYDTTTGIVWVAPIPEPSMFGIFAGLGALGLVATRRRRRAA